MLYTKYFSPKVTQQTDAIPGKNMVKNAAGGYAFEITPQKMLERFLILGTEGGTYYTGEMKFTKDSALNVIKCITNDGLSTVATILDISVNGKAPKNSPALFALALCTSPDFASVETRRAAFNALHKVARISTHLFEFITYMKTIRGWGKLAKSSVSDWYQLKSPDALEYQMVKYRKRLGWTHNDVLRLAKPIPKTKEMDQLYEFAKNGAIEGEHNFKLIEGFNKVQTAESVAEVLKCISDYKIPMETIPTQFKKEREVWEALLPNLPITATIRNLRNMAKYGVLDPMSEASKLVADRISNKDIIAKGRVHPMQFLNAICIYPRGNSEINSDGYAPRKTTSSIATWNVDPKIVEALNDGFMGSFKNVKPTGKRTMIALDVSGSMSWNYCLGAKELSAREASAAMAMLTINTESNHMVGIFTRKFEPFTAIRKGTYIDEAIKSISNLPFGGTDIAQPILWSIANNIQFDVIQVFTDNETWAGRIHPCQALVKHRQKFSTNTKLVVNGMTAMGYSIADPEDPGMLDVVGFDTATPEVISKFIAMQ